MPKRTDIQKVLISGYGRFVIGIALLLACLLTARIALSECVEVVVSPQPCFRNVRITALLKGVPVQNAKVEIAVDGSQPPMPSLVTDAHGAAVLPALKPGVYVVTVTSGDALHSELDLHVMEDAEDKVSVFSVELQPGPTAQLLATQGG